MKSSDFHKFLSEQGKNWTLEDESAIHEFIKHKEAELCSVFIRAVNEYDGDKIVELAQSVWFFKGKFEKNAKGADDERARLLIEKAFLNMQGKKWTARQAAEFITGDKSPAKDKIDSIRDKCREMDFPLTSERKIRKK